MADEEDLPSYSADAYTVAIVCALPHELTACRQMLDTIHDPPVFSGNETNIYNTGTIGKHFVVLSCLPAKRANTGSAAAVITGLLRDFQQVRFTLLVGIAGGVPSDAADIRLSDIVVSQPEGAHGGVVHYDFGKTTEQGYEMRGHLSKPPDLLLNALSQIQSLHDQQPPRLYSYMQKVANNDYLRLNGYERPDVRDRLFHGDEEVERPERTSNDPQIFYGLIASGNKIIAKEGFRDELKQENSKILCVETEAAGIMDSTKCLVIRGICDYADKHKGDHWQKWAAVCAAAYAKELLLVVPAKSVTEAMSPALSMCKAYRAVSTAAVPRATDSSASIGLNSTILEEPTELTSSPGPPQTRFKPTGLAIRPAPYPNTRTQSAPTAMVSQATTRRIFAACHDCGTELPQPPSYSTDDYESSLVEREVTWCCVCCQIYCHECGKKAEDQECAAGTHELFPVRDFHDNARSKKTKCRGCILGSWAKNTFFGVGCEECEDFFCHNCAQKHLTRPRKTCDKTQKRCEFDFWVGGKKRAKVEARLLKGFQS